MAGSVNKVILVGRLVADVETRIFQNGGKVVNMRVATSEKWTKDGEKKEVSQFHSVAIFNEPLGKIAEQYLSKGSTVYIEGQLETRKYVDSNGSDRWSTEVVLRPYRGELVLLGGKPSDEGSTYGDKPKGDGYGGGGRPNNDMDDEIPFAMEWRI